jgi:hypothetical protein
MAFEERQRFVRAYRAAVQAYNEAGAGFDTLTFHDALHQMESARNKVEAARVVLLKHENLYVDPAAKAKDAGTNRAANGSSTVVLFNVDTERWVIFESVECGPPPEGALAYAAMPDHQRGEWIADAREMSARENQNMKLYYTEAGLALLREAGLEM